MGVKKRWVLAALALVAVLLPATAVQAEEPALTTIIGVITDDLGNPMPGAVVRAYPAHPADGTWSFGIGSHADESGAFSLEVPVDQYVLVALAEGFATTTSGGTSWPTMDQAVDVTAAGATIDVTLNRLATVTVTMTYPGGAPYEGGDVGASLSAPQNAIAFFPPDVSQYTGVSAKTGPDGSATVSVLPGATRVVGYAEYGSPWIGHFVGGGYWESDGPPVELSSGGTYAYDVEVELGGVVTGAVTDELGQPVAGVYVDAWTYLDEGNCCIGNRGVTDDDGRYVVHGLIPGDFEVKTSAEGYITTYHPSATTPAAATRVPVQPGQTVTGIDIQLQLGVTIDARLWAAPDVPAQWPAGLWICNEGVGLDYSGGIPTCADGLSVPLGGSNQPEPGRFVTTDIRPGTYNLFGVHTWDFLTSPAMELVLTNPGDRAVCDLYTDGTPSTCEVVPGVVGPGDDDGVADDDEAGVNETGDGNGDEIPDAEQTNVTSIPASTEGGGYVTVAAPEGTSLSSVTTADPAAEDLPPLPPGSSTEAPVVAYTVDDVPVGETVDIDVFFTTPVEANSYLKLQGGQWVPLPEEAYTIVSPTHIVLHLVDGGVGDEDGAANGTIVDPGMPALLDRTPPTIECPATAQVLLNGIATITATVTDAASGPTVSTVSSSVPTSTAGLQVVELTATDLAGNVATQGCTAHVVYAVAFVTPSTFGGIAEMSAGRSVNLTFRLLDAHGLAVPTPEAVTSLDSTPIACPSGSGTALKSTGGDKSADPAHLGNGWWTASWYARPAWAGTCRLLSLSFDDGTVRSMIIRVR